MKPMDALREQLAAMVEVRTGLTKAHGFPYRCAEDLVLRHGAEYTLAPPRCQPRFRYARACFDSAYRLSTRSRSPWIYVEGFALSNVGLAVHHAWVTHRRSPDLVYELAWDDDPDAVYLGIAFVAGFVRETFAASKSTQYSVIDAYWQGFPLLTGVQPLDEVRWKGIAA